MAYCQVKDTLKGKYSEARTCLLHGNIERAEKIAYYLVKIDSLNGRYYDLLGDINLEMNQFDKSLIFYKLSYNKCGSKLKYYRNLKLLYSQANKADSSLFYLNKMIEIKSDSAFLYEERSIYKLDLKDMNGVKEDLKKAIELGDQNAVKLLKILTDGENK